MNFLLDTNVVSEWVKPRPNPGLIRWLESADEDRLFLSVVTVAELHYGVERMPPSMRRTTLERWLESDLTQRFEKRVLGVNREIAVTWGKVVSDAERSGRPVSVMDAFLAATARVRDLTLVTRNTGHFPMLEALLSPWA